MNATLKRLTAERNAARERHAALKRLTAEHNATLERHNADIHATLERITADFHAARERQTADIHATIKRCISTATYRLLGAMVAGHAVTISVLAILINNNL